MRGSPAASSGAKKGSGFFAPGLAKRRRDGRCGRLESHGQEDHLPRREASREGEGVARRADDANVTAMSALDLEASPVPRRRLRRTRNAEHVAERRDRDTGPPGEIAGEGDIARGRDADGAPRARGEAHAGEKKRMKPRPGRGHRVRSADLHDSHRSPDFFREAPDAFDETKDLCAAPIPQGRIRCEGGTAA